jgi:ABC-type phosphate transport system substrate-binding protein
MRSFLSSSFLASTALAQQHNCGPAAEDTSDNNGNSEIQIAGSGSLERLAGAWMQGFEKPDVFPNSITIMVEAGGSSSGAARVCGTSTKSPVDVGGMSRLFNSGEASTENGWNYECERSPRSAIQVKREKTQIVESIQSILSFQPVSHRGF